MILEKAKTKKKKRDFACVMLSFPELSMSKFRPFGINRANVYDNKNHEYGLEKEPHCTILYGLHDWDIKDADLKKCIFDNIEDEVEELETRLVKVNFFEGTDKETGEQYDVVKWEVESPDLTHLNQVLRENFPYTTNYPDYKAHITIGYFKKGTGKNYFYQPEEPIILRSNVIKYTKTTGEKKFWKI